MQLNKNELQTINKIAFYKALSIFSMCLSAAGVPLGLYARFFRYHTRSELFLNDALIGASLVVFGLSSLLYNFIRIIEKLKSGAKESF